jgi:hypothetical protein
MAITTNGKVSITNLQVGSSADLAGIISDESGTGVLAFTNSPSFTTPALGTPSAVTLTNATGLPVSGITASTSSAIGVGSVELGHATDTTIARVSAGVVSIEGVNVVTTSSTDTLTNKTLTTPIINGPTITATGQTPTIHGIYLPDSHTIIFEGTTANDFETTLQVIDPTADRTISLPDATGTVALTSDITVTASSSTTLTNKSISLSTNTVTGTLAEFNTAISDADVASLAGTETLTNKTLTDAKVNLAFDAETASYTAVLANNSQVVTMDNASANTFSIPTNASVAFPVGTQINVLQIGAGQTTIQAVTSGTTTILSTGATAAAPKLRTRYSMATCIKSATDTWYVVGDIS